MFHTLFRRGIPKSKINGGNSKHIMYPYASDIIISDENTLVLDDSYNHYPEYKVVEKKSIWEEVE